VKAERLTLLLKHLRTQAVNADDMADRLQKAGRLSRLTDFLQANGYLDEATDVLAFQLAELGGVLHLLANVLYGFELGCIGAEQQAQAGPGGPCQCPPPKDPPTGPTTNPSAN
jgi:hypothetical protein